MEEIKEKLKEISGKLEENTIRLAEYNGELRVHIQASKDLHTRMIPLEQHVAFQRNIVALIVKSIAWSFGVAASMAAIAAALVKIFR